MKTLWFAWKPNSSRPWTLYHTLKDGDTTKCGHSIVGQRVHFPGPPEEKYCCKSCFSLIEIEDDSICIEDFNGKYVFPTAWWCDWENGIVRFGGEWEDVPDMPLPQRPTLRGLRKTRRECYKWVKKHTGRKYPHA